jgi:hypothetical protein
METTTPQEQSIGACSPIKPEWLRIPDAIRVSGLGRSTIYNLIGAGLVKSAVIRRRGCQGESDLLVRIRCLDISRHARKEVQDNERASNR